MKITIDRASAVYIAVWVAMAGSALLTQAAGHPWATLQDKLTGGAALLAALATALMHPPALPASLMPAPKPNA